MMRTLITLLTLALLIPGMALGITRIVKLDGSGDYTSIQAALNAAQSGDTVLVYPGRYYENLTIQTNNLSLISLEAQTNNPAYIDSTIIDGTRTTSVVAVGQNKQNITVRGFTITNGKGNGINFGPSSIAFLTNCHIMNNIASNGGGISVACALVTISGVSVYNNYAVYLGGGLYVMSGGGFANNVILDPVNRCSIYNNRSGLGQDIYVQDATSNLNVSLDTFSVAVPTTYYAIFLTQNEANHQMTFDIQNAHHQEINQDIYVAPDGDDDNDGLSPSTPLKTIQEGIYRVAADSLNQKTVHLLPGTYSRTDNDQIFPIALKSWVKVQGSGIDSTEVVGEPHPLIPVGYGSAEIIFMTYMEPVVSIADISVTTMDTDNSCIILGFKKGSLNLANVRIYDVTPNYFAAISAYLSNDYDCVWDNVTIENIITPDMGLIDINGCISGTISNSKFRNATSTYTSASVWAYSLVSFRGDRHLTFDNCEFSNLTMSDDNSSAIAVGGVQFPQQSNNFSFNNCLFSNINTHSEMIYVGSKNQPNLSFTNCTFAGNEGDSYTLLVNGNVNITNSIFYNDTPYQIKVNPMTGYNEPTTLNIDYSCIKDGMAGIQQAPGNTINYAATNLSSDPLFRGEFDIHDPLYYSLSSASPCINAGTPDTTALDLLPYDLAGNWRIWDHWIDMGCFEYGSEPWVDNDDPFLPQPEGCILYQNYPNPFNPATTITYQLPESGKVRLDVYNLKGQMVKTLIDSTQVSGMHSIEWNGTDTENRSVASGVYLYRLSSLNNVQTKRMLLMK